MRFSPPYLRTLFFLIVCFSTLAQTVNAQTSTSQPPAQDIVRISTELAQADVTVLDAQGRFVNGLRREDFDLRIQGKPSPIEFFEQVSTPGKEQRPQRNIIFFIDDLHLKAEALPSISAGLINFVEQQMQADDHVAIVSASGQVGFLQQFTDNAEVLRLAISRIKPRVQPVQDSESVAMSEYVAYRIAQGDRAALTYYTNEMLRSLQFTYALPKYGGKGAGYQAGSEPEQAERMVMRRAEAMIAQSIQTSLVSLSSLERFLRASAQPRGRKIVFHISDGFLMHGRNNELVRAIERVNEAASFAHGVIYSVDARAFATGQQSSLMKVDSLGRSDAFASGESEALHVGRKVMSETTGGRTITAKSFQSAFDEALRETGSYYVLAWRPENEEHKTEKFTGLSVSIVGRPELKTRLSANYAVVAPKSTESTIPSSVGLPTRLSVAYLNTPANGNVLTASTEITVDETSAEDKKATVVELAGVVLNDQGKVSASFQKQLTVHPLTTQKQSGNTSVIYNHRMSLPPGIYQVRIAARHKESGRLGRTSEWIDIPDLTQGKLLMSSLLLERTQSGSAAAADTSLQFQQSVARHFSTKSRLSFMTFVYNAKRPVNLNADIRVIQKGQTVLTIPQLKVPIEGSTDLQRIPFGGSFSLSTLKPGRYLLLVTITDHGMKAMQQIDFELE